MSRSRCPLFYAPVCGPWQNALLVRRRAHRLLLAGLVLAATGVVVPLLTTSAGAGTEAPATAQDQTYPTDPSEGSSADIKDVSVSDSSDGTVTWNVTFYNISCISGLDALAIAIDSVAGGGPAGADYAVQIGGDSGTALFRWNGSGWSADRVGSVVVVRLRRDRLAPGIPG